MKAIRWRRYLVALHRDVGFLCVGLTVVYAVSGVAVNHRHDWDYNYTHDKTLYEVGGPADVLGLAADDPGRILTAGKLARERQEAVVVALTAALGRDDQPYNAFWRGPGRLSLFFGRADFDVVDYDPGAGTAVWEEKSERFLLRAMNFLHLNEPKGIWTWIADAFAVLLFFLALSGALIIRGRRGIVGRGGVLILVGIVVPLVAVILLQ